jgi:hypothetical protein
MSSELFIDYLPDDRLHFGADLFFEHDGEAFPDFVWFDEQHNPNSRAVSINSAADSDVILTSTHCPVFAVFTAVTGIRIGKSPLKTTQ